MVETVAIEATVIGFARRRKREQQNHSVDSNNCRHTGSHIRNKKTNGPMKTDAAILLLS